MITTRQQRLDFPCMICDNCGKEFVGEKPLTNPYNWKRTRAKSWIKKSSKKNGWQLEGEHIFCGEECRKKYEEKEKWNKQRRKYKKYDLVKYREIITLVTRDEYCDRTVRLQFDDRCAPAEDLTLLATQEKIIAFKKGGQNA